MSEDRTTRRLVDLQVLTGVGALCLAERNPLLAALAAGGYLAVRLGHRAGAALPLPRWATNLGALGAVGLLLLEVQAADAVLVVAMGHFTVLLQGLLLAGTRGSRDDAMLLVLGLVQVLAASVLSSTVLDGAALMLWCAVGAAALTRLSLRAARERVAARNAALGPGGAGSGVKPGAPEGPGGGEEPRAAAPILRVQTAGLVVATLVAAAVFVAIPRRDGGARPEAVAGVGALRGVGFAARVELGGTPPERVLRGPVLHATIRQGGDNLGADGRHFLLRGAALDRYDPATRSWTRSGALSREDVLLRLGPAEGGSVRLAGVEPPADGWEPGAWEGAGGLGGGSGGGGSGGGGSGGGGSGGGGEPGALTRAPGRDRLLWEVDAVQRGGRLDTLFLPTARMRAAASPVLCRVPGAHSVSFNPLDGRIQAVDRVGSDAASYRVTVSPLRDDALTTGYARFRAVPPPALDPRARGGRRPGWLRWLRPAGEAVGPGPVPVQVEVDPGVESRRWEVEPERVAALAGNVLAAAGLPRDPAAGPLPGDRRRVERLEHFLRTGFTYTLDNPAVPPGEDPVIRFLFERRSGHCELFAAGLVALCRSVGIPARVATGFRAGEFNAAGGYYVVRPEHAHAWAEAAMGVVEPEGPEGPGGGASAGGLPTGWTTFDATPPARVRAEHQRGGPVWFRRLRHAFEHAEYTWVSRVVAFGPRTRERAFAELKAAAVAVFSDRVGWTRFLPAGASWRVGAASVALLLSLGACVLGLRLVRRDRSARRRAALRPAAFDGLSGVLGAPGSRRAGFYLRLLDALERQGHERPPAATPAAWAAGLAARDPARLGAVPRVTEAFYRVRFGGEPPGPAELREIDAAVSSIAAAGEPRPR